MAIVKTVASVSEATQGQAAFDHKYTPGQKVPHSGIYKCAGCGDEIAANESDPFPPQNHHQHSPKTVLGLPSPIEWQLLVFAQSKK